MQRNRTQAAEEFKTLTSEALNCYRQAANPDISPPLIQTQAQLNALSLLLDRQQWILDRLQLRLDRRQWPEAAAAIPTLYSRLDSLPPSRAVIYARINLAQSLMRIAEIPSAQASLPNSFDPLSQAEQLLATAQRQANALGLDQAESYALGVFGRDL